MGRSMSGGFAAAIALGLLAVPAAAQQLSDSYTFLKAVRDRDGNKVQDMVGSPGSIVINTRERGSLESALHIVVRERDYNWLSFLLGRGAKPDLQNKDGDTPLGLAAQLGWVEGAQELVNRRASVDLPNNKGETPLILAVHKRDVALVRLLLAKGASPKKTDNVAGYSALDYAKRDPRAAPLVKMLEAPPTPPRAVAGPR
jgi:uncharacterized protein